LLGKHSSRFTTRSEQRKVNLYASPIDGPAGEATGRFIGVRPGGTSADGAVPGSGSVQGQQGEGVGRGIDASQSSDAWGQITPAQPAVAPKPNLLDEGALMNWSERIRDAEEALESLEQNAKRKRGRGKWVDIASRQQAIAPEWHSLRDGLRARAERPTDSEDVESGSGDFSDDEFDEPEDFEDAEEDLAAEEDFRAQADLEPRADFTTMNEVTSLPTWLCAGTDWLAVERRYRHCSLASLCSIQ
jgi:hypothetical protein